MIRLLIFERVLVLVRWQFNIFLRNGLGSRGPGACVRMKSFLVLGALILSDGTKLAATVFISCDPFHSTWYSPCLLPV